MDELLIPFAKEHLKTQSVMQVYIIIKIFARKLEIDTSMGYWIPKLTELKEEVEREKDVNVPEAVAKQTAKKPIVKEGYRYCPNCGGDEDSIMYDNMISSRYNYCKDCGQKLDWSDYK